ncbi:MAG: pentapeptide repeat-containing protein [Oculatellaceae cyanobacterium bins.114]|nr:pentapeptide repeat-containing protein [Oculatellaceae cyanobacterium bins.114]
MTEESPEQKYLWLKRSRAWVLYWLNRLPTALEVLFLVAIIRLLENTPVGKTFISWLGIHSFLDIIESVSILVAVFIYFKEGPERQKRSRYEAWKVIDAAHGRRNSYARIQALQDLNEEGISLRGLDAPKADLREINLRKAILLNANLQRADLLEANLQKADLRAANLCRANLQRADLQKADLRAANLLEANLLGANLENTNLKAADLTDAKLRATNLKGANLLGANLQGADLRIAEHLTPEQIKVARNWTEALYDTELSAQLGLPPQDEGPATELFFRG